MYLYIHTNIQTPALIQAPALLYSWVPLLRGQILHTEYWIQECIDKGRRSTKHRTRKGHPHGYLALTGDYRYITHPIGGKYRVLYVLEWRTAYALARGLFWCLFPELRSSEGNKHQNNTRVSASTIRHESTYIVLFLARHDESINDNKNDGLYTSSPGPARFTVCWWRHNRLLMTSQWPEHWDASTLGLISNSSDIILFMVISTTGCVRKVYTASQWW